jgi:hypothetical protein
MGLVVRVRLARRPWTGVERHHAQTTLVALRVKVTHRVLRRKTLSSRALRMMAHRAAPILLEVSLGHRALTVTIPPDTALHLALVVAVIR